MSPVGAIVALALAAPPPGDPLRVLPAETAKAEPTAGGRAASTGPAPASSESRRARGRGLEAPRPASQERIGRPEAAVFPTRPGPSAPPVRADHRRAFALAFERVVGAELEGRRWRVGRSEAAARALARSCDDATCTREAARTLGADRWVESVLAPAGEGGCRVEARLFRTDQPEPLRTVEAELPRCSADALLTCADALGRSLAAGPRWRPPTELALASTPVPDLDVRDLPDVRPPELTATSTGPRPLPLDVALDRYRREAIVAFRDDLGALRFARGGQLLGECGVRRAAGAPLSREQRVFCRGNAWVWALVAVPAGALTAAVSFPELEQGNLPGFVGVSVGTVAAVAGAALALTQTEFGHDPRDGAYLSDPAELRALAEARNHALRRELGLTAAEVEAARLQSPFAVGAGGP